ncbi:lytic murein transglycosylase [Bradyrhizobium sp. HKCCYLS20291]|uniref:lytic murein transglycosylase n=1 Tax=Bradyrhizobium sp. HKCCYLS20291 TaxID=3420766 RepID=UPI003EBAB9F1
MTVIFLLLFGGAAGAGDFDRWREQLWSDAEKRGIKRQLFDEATNVPLDLTLPDLALPNRPTNEQAEFGRLPADYISRQQISALAAKGRQYLSTYRRVLAETEAKYGVPGHVIIAIWGRETDYGSERERHYVIPSLLTLAYHGKRKDQFREELLIALELVQEGKMRRDAVGSWTGAMGHTQFEPSDIRKFAVDGDGDGKIDLINSIPDALASAGKQLHDYGWRRARKWAIEVRLSPNVSCVESSSTVERTLAEWLDLGAFPASRMGVSIDMLDEPAILLMPAGIYGPAFLAFENFKVFRRYNQSDNYAIFVGHLADRIAGGSDFETPWTKLPLINTREVLDIQQMLQGSGDYTGAIDGRLGSATRRAIGMFQQRLGLKVDCWVSSALLNSGRGKTTAPGTSPAGAASR